MKLKKTRKVAPITEFEIQFINLVNKTLLEKGLNVNNLARMCGSYNYGNFQRYFLEKKGQFRSRTLGKVADVLELKLPKK
jgi:hypothetical protein